MSGFHRKMRMLTGVLLLSASSLLYAGMEDEESVIYPLGKGTRLGIGGVAAMECGQYINSFYQNQRTYDDRPWILRTKARLDFKATVGNQYL